MPTYDIPGNFGIRAIESMPTDIRTVHIPQLNNMNLGYACDDRPTIVPEKLEAPDVNDYLTDEESDEVNDFEIKVPELTDILNEFEKEDEVIQQHIEKLNEYKTSQINKGFEPERRYDIKDDVVDRKTLLNNNISMQREQ